VDIKGITTKVTIFSHPSKSEPKKIIFTRVLEGFCHVTGKTMLQKKNLPHFFIPKVILIMCQTVMGSAYKFHANNS